MFFGRFQKCQYFRSDVSGYVQIYCLCKRYIYLNVLRIFIGKLYLIISSIFRENKKIEVMV